MKRLIALLVAVAILYPVSSNASSEQPPCGEPMHVLYEDKIHDADPHTGQVRTRYEWKCVHVSTYIFDEHRQPEVWEPVMRSICADLFWKQQRGVTIERRRCGT